MKKVVSLALFGENTRYAAYIGAFVRAHLTLFPQAEGWQLHIMVDEHNVLPLLTEMAMEGLLAGLTVMPDAAPLTKAMLWRLLPIWQITPWDVDYVFCRDVDALPTPRDRAACDRFIASGCDVHAVHDSRSHDGVMGGLSGYAAAAFREGTKIESLEALYTLANRTDEEWAVHGTDQHVLNALVLGWGAERGGRDAALYERGKKLALFEHRWAGWAGGKPGVDPGRKPSPRACVSEAVPDCTEIDFWKSLTECAGCVEVVEVVDNLNGEADALSSHLGAAGFDIDRAIAFYDEYGDPEMMRLVREAK